jgi:hypothetical protein
MKFKEDRPFANPEAALVKLLEIAHAVEADHARLAEKTSCAVPFNIPTQLAQSLP